MLKQHKVYDILDACNVINQHTDINNDCDDSNDCNLQKIGSEYQDIIYAMHRYFNVDFLHQDTLVDDVQYAELLKIISAIQNGQSVARIFHSKQFYNIDCILNNNVFEPRYDTEIIVQSLINIINQDYSEGCKFIEFGSGTGCITTSVLMNTHNTSAVCIDSNYHAIKNTDANISKYNLSSRASYINQNWQDICYKNIKCNIVVSNPPYLLPNEYDETLKYDPIDACVGGENGLSCYKQISCIAYDIIEQNGYLLFEIGLNQCKSVFEIGRDAGFTPYAVYYDYADIIRSVIFRKI